MSAINRSIYKYLSQWKENPHRKVLLLRGARQVGKTYAVRQFAREFRNFVEINLLEEPRVAKLFSAGSLDPGTILEGISALKGLPLNDGETLLFIDEIQASKEAITALRFFYEKRPQLHIIASGSLLEFALEDVHSFGVGRVEYLYMYPLSFGEYLVFQGHDAILSLMRKCSPTSPMMEPLHAKCQELYRRYLCLGGMPEVIARFGQADRMSDLHQASILMGNIITGYEDDLASYRKRLSVEYLSETFRSSALQAGKKFIYSHAFRDANSKSVHRALELLVKAGVVHKVFHSDGNDKSVLASEVDLKKFKTIPHDIGIYNRLCGLHLSDIATSDPLALGHKGSLAEIACGLSLLWSREPFSQDPIYYWHREAKSSNAEVDYILETSAGVIPIEVKASGKGAMHSMYAFLKAKGSPFGIRVSTENFGRYDNILTVPLYASGELNRIASEMAG